MRSEGKMMIKKEVFQGVPGMLRPFKEFLEANGFAPGDQIVYYGCPGTCTPFVELLAFAVRGMKLSQVFVPYLDEKGARSITLVPEVGMQASDKIAINKPVALIVMGGLSMPNVPVEVHQMKEVMSRHPDATKIGVCFMNMFEKAGWLKELSFNLLIDATISPVEVLREE
jgi:hypothetical protein